MGWDDRPYYHDRSGSSTNPLLWIFTGSVPLFTAFGIRVRAHVGLILLILLEILLDYKNGYPIQWRAMSMGLLVLFVILHEFGHCFMARRLGGTANDVLLWPLGGLAMTDPPHRPQAVMLTALAGPMVNFFICAVSGTALFAMNRTLFHLSLNPFMGIPMLGGAWTVPVAWVWWVFEINYILLLVNLLPIYPLDGGQVVQAMLWPAIGHFRSMVISTVVGMSASILMIVISLTMADKNWFLFFLGVFTFVANYQQRSLLRESGPEEWQDGVDYNASIYGLNESPQPKRKRLSRRAILRARRIAQRESAERTCIDTILAKVSAHGMNSLSWRERRALRKATERHRRRELELSKFQ